jgi:hypothetical protein
MAVRVILLVLVTENHIDSLFKKVITSSCQHDNVVLYFAHGGSEFRHDGHDLFFPIKDNFENMLLKTQLAIEYIERTHKGQYDYLVRSNMSTLFDIPKLLVRLETFPRERCFSGPMIAFNDRPIVSGTAIILSQDMVHYVLQDACLFRMPGSGANNEDMVINRMIPRPFYFAHVPRLDFIGHVLCNNGYPGSDILCFRFKTADRRHDVERMKQVLAAIQNEELWEFVNSLPEEKCCDSPITMYLFERAVYIS